METERGMVGKIPYAAVGSGRPVVVCAGLWPTTGVDSDVLVRGALDPLRRLAADRRLIVLNRRADLPRGMSMSDLAAEYADAIRADLDGPVDILGTSTGGSIAQQLAADHPDTVRRLVLVSTACRLGSVGRSVQGRMAAHLCAGRTRAAVGLAASDIAPWGLGLPARVLGWTAARHVVPDAATATDLAVTLAAEDAFDLARCRRPIQARTLIVAGARDRFYGRELFAETAEVIPQSHLRLFRWHGHITVTGAPRAQAMIAGFLSHP